MAREIEARDLVATLLNNLGELARIRGDYERARVLYEESLNMVGAMPTVTRATGVLNLGLVASSQADYPAARSYFGESLAISQKLGDKSTSASCLEGLAGVHAMQGQPEDGARLLGAADALRKVLNSPVQSGERANYDRSVAAVRAGLGDTAFAAAWSEGGAMTLDEAIEYALSAGGNRE